MKNQVERHANRQTEPENSGEAMALGALDTNG